MKGKQKILQINSNTSKLLDSLCFQLSVNVPDQNSLSLLQIVQWKSNKQISDEQFKQLYTGWLQSKNIYDLFSAKQIRTYPKQQLVINQSDVKRFLNNSQITKTLQILNSTYNDIYINKKNRAKGQIKKLEDTQKLFSFLDYQGVIHLRLSQIYFLTGAFIIAQGNSVPQQYDIFKKSIKALMKDMCQIDGKISLRWFKNYFMSCKKPNLASNIHQILIETQKLSSLLCTYRLRDEQLPNLLSQSVQTWKTYPRFHRQTNQKKIDIFKRLFEQNEYLFFLDGKNENGNIYEDMRDKYGQDFMDCFELSEVILSQFSICIKDTLNKYLQILFRTSAVFKQHKSVYSTSYINSSSYSREQINNKNSNLYTTQKKKPLPSDLNVSSKMISKTSMKDKTPKKKKTTDNEIFYTNRNRTPTHRNQNSSIVRRQFGSASKQKDYSKNKNNQSAFINRNLTPTKSQQGSGPQLIQSYRGAKKIGLQKNNFYQKLFFFRNKRVQSYQIVMKRLKNK